jgi:hypothetical protein
MYVFYANPQGWYNKGVRAGDGGGKIGESAFLPREQPVQKIIHKCHRADFPVQNLEKAGGDGHFELVFFREHFDILRRGRSFGEIAQFANPGQEIV